MSIQVNDFRWEPGKNDTEYIKLLKSSRDEWQKIAQKAIAKLKALSKAQEQVAPVKVNRYMETDENGDWFSPETYDCGNCGVELHGKANYCHLCGKKVLWE